MAFEPGNRPHGRAGLNTILRHEKKSVTAHTASDVIVCAEMGTNSGAGSALAVLRGAGYWGRLWRT